MTTTTKKTTAAERKAAERKRRRLEKLQRMMAEIGPTPPANPADLIPYLDGTVIEVLRFEAEREYVPGAEEKVPGIRARLMAAADAMQELRDHIARSLDAAR